MWSTGCVTWWITAPHQKPTTCQCGSVVAIGLMRDEIRFKFNTWSPEHHKSQWVVAFAKSRQLVESGAHRLHWKWRYIAFYLSHDLICLCDQKITRLLLVVGPSLTCHPAKFAGRKSSGKGEMLYFTF